jgi:hypothetical protein
MRFEAVASSCAGVAPEPLDLLSARKGVRESPLSFSTLEPCRRAIHEVVEEVRSKGNVKPLVTSLAGDVRLRKRPNTFTRTASRPTPTRPMIPVQVLGAKYKWARGEGLP